MTYRNEIVYILDRSGSMANLTADTVSGFNKMLRRQRAKGMNALVSVALFNGKLVVPYYRIPLEEIPFMTEKYYSAYGNTALYDAVGTMTDGIRNEQLHKGKPEKTLFFIITDGLENASRNYTAADVQKRIAYGERRSWEFLYLGANIDAASEAQKIGIRADHAVRFCADGEGIRNNFEAITSATVSYCATPNGTIPNNWKQSIEEDYRQRGNHGTVLEKW